MISVLVPTRNRADLLSDAIHSFLSQTLEKELFEIIIIDNGSTDHTADIVRIFNNKLPNLRYIYAEKPGLHVGRHKGMEEARGDILVFADDDIEATPLWLETYHHLFSDPKVAMAGGNNFPLFLESPPDWLEKIWAQPFSEGGRALPTLSILELKGKPREFSPYLVWGCNFAVRKSLLKDAGGFHPDGMPKELIRFRGDGETHVSRYIKESGLKCMFHPNASVHHKVTPERMTCEYFRQRGFNQGVSDSYSTLRDREKPSFTTRSNLLKRTITWVWNNLRNQYYLNSEARFVLNEFKKGYREGYAYHQNSYANDPVVRAWVHQSYYY